MTYTVSAPGATPLINQPSRLFLWIAVLLIFSVGLGIRFFDLTDLFLDFHPTRQLHSALMARGMYFQTLTDVPEWQREMAVNQWHAEGLIEPPILEGLVAFTYRLIGEPVLWVARIYSILFWGIGGIFLFLLSRRMAGVYGALFAITLYFLLPYGVTASRVFQPDPLMVVLIVAGYWALYRWHESPSWLWTVVAGIILGLAILVKAVAIFFVAGAVFGLILGFLGLQKAVRNPKVWVLGILIIIPYALYHIYGTFIVGTLGSQFSLRFFPELWKDPVWYLRWFGQIKSVVGFSAFLVAILGTFLFETRAQRSMFMGIWVGYFVYGLTLPYHIYTHDYYNLPLIPVVALALAPVFELIYGRISQIGNGQFGRAAVIAVVLFGMSVTAWDNIVSLKRVDYRHEVAYWENLGEKLGHQTSVVALSHDYGYRLGYWGWLTTTNWMTGGDLNIRAMAGQEYDMVQVFAEETAGKEFFLVTLMDEFANQSEIKQILYDHYSIFDQGDGYIIFDLRAQK